MIGGTRGPEHSPIAGDLVVLRRAPRRAYRLQAVEDGVAVAEAIGGSCTIGARLDDLRPAAELDLDLSDDELAAFAAGDDAAARMACEIERRRALAREERARTDRAEALVGRLADLLSTVLAEIRVSP